MKAWVLHGINDLRLDEVPLPIPKDGEVIVNVKAAGICSSDIQRIFTSGAARARLGRAPCREIA